MPEVYDGVELPSTLARSPEEAKRTWVHTLKSARESYGEGERARRTAFSALKHSFEKVGDHWEQKAEKGPSDPQAARGPDDGSAEGGETYAGVDVVGHTRAELFDQARSIEAKVTTRMKKVEVAEAIVKRQRTLDARALREEREA